MSSNNFGARYFSLFLQIFVFAMNGTTYACMYLSPCPCGLVNFPLFLFSFLLIPLINKYLGISSSIPRPPAKRAASLAFINSVGNAASIWTPYTYRTKDAPYYRPALGTCIALQVVAFTCAITLRVILKRQNARLARMDDADSQLTEKDKKKLELTAKVEGITVAEARSLQKGFRYLI